MSRIIAGRAGGLRLVVPTGGTRPTAERVREAIFSRLEHLLDFHGLAVLDLYAGSGALGLEAVSRGAASATLVDSDARAAAACRTNCATTGLQARVVQATTAAFLRRPPTVRYGLVFLDPPYALEAREVAAVLEGLVAHLEPGAMVVVETAARGQAPAWPAGWGEVGERRYGDTVVRYATASNEQET